MNNNNELQSSELQNDESTHALLSVYTLVFPIIALAFTLFSNFATKNLLVGIGIGAIAYYTGLFIWIKLAERVEAKKAPLAKSRLLAALISAPIVSALALFGISVQAGMICFGLCWILFMFLFGGL